MKIFLNVAKTEDKPKRDLKADFTTSDPGKYMAVITKDKIFIVLRKGRNLNKYGVQYCLRDYYLTMWNQFLKDHHIKWSEGIVKQEHPTSYEAWVGLLKKAHVEDARNAMQS